MAVPDTFYDLELLITLRKVLRDVGEVEEPQAKFLSPTVAPSVRRLALLPGSFNPPTLAHLALARTVVDTKLVEAVDFVLATRTVNKERLEGLSLDDRLLLLLRVTDEHPELGLVVVNRGLYVDQAEIVRTALAELDRLWFIVGFDKIVQIFDPRYYADRDVALRRLFSLASFFVAPRGDRDFSDLAALLGMAENRQFADGITPLPLPKEFREVSSSRLRAQATATGGFPDVPPFVAEFLEETGAFASPVHGAPGDAVDRYAWREYLVDLGESGRLRVSSPSEFRDLIHAGATTDSMRRRVRERYRTAPALQSEAGSPGFSF